MIITAIMGFFMLFPYYFGVPAIEKISSNLQNWTVVLLAFALAYGVLSMSIIHIRKINEKREGWQYSVALLVSMFGIMITGFIPPLLSHRTFQWIFNSMQVRLSVAVYALLAPYIASAAYRAFRARSLDAMLMLVAAFFTMMMNAPIGGSLWQGFNVVGGWIYSTPNMAVQRGILIGIAVGTVAQGLRIFAGFERSHLGEERGEGGG